jgi:hypothetical protein
LALVLFADTDRTTVLPEVCAFDVEATTSVEYERLINRTVPTIVLYAAASTLYPETDMFTAPHSARHTP